MAYDPIEPQTDEDFAKIKQNQKLKPTPTFSDEDLSMIAHALYQTYNKLGYTNNISEEIKEKSASIQRKINSYLKFKEVELKGD